MHGLYFHPSLHDRFIDYRIGTVKYRYNFFYQDLNRI